MRLVFLKVHARIAELAANQRIVLVDYHRQFFIAFSGCKMFFAEAVFDLSGEDAFAAGDLVGERRDLAEELAGYDGTF